MNRCFSLLPLIKLTDTAQNKTCANSAVCCLLDTFLDSYLLLHFQVLFDAAKRLGVEPKMLTQQTLSAALKGKQGVVKFEEAMPLIHFLLGAGTRLHLTALEPNSSGILNDPTVEGIH